MSLRFSLVSVHFFLIGYIKTLHTWHIMIQKARSSVNLYLVTVLQHYQLLCLKSYNEILDNHDTQLEPSFGWKQWWVFLIKLFFFIFLNMFMMLKNQKSIQHAQKKYDKFKAMYYKNSFLFMNEKEMLCF